MLNFGVIPGGATGTELQAMTRRAVMPAVVPQIGKSTVYISSMLAAAEPVTGGVSPVTVPVQGSRMVAGQWTDYSGMFAPPTVLPGLQNAEYNLAALVIGVPYYLFEGFVQQDAELVPILWARLNDAGNLASDLLAQAAFAALSANTNLQPFSLNDIFATSNPSQGNVGNIDRTANSFWQATVKAMTAINGTSQAWTRANVLNAINSLQAVLGEPPSCVIVHPGAWAAVAGDAIGAESYLVDKEGTYADAAEGATFAFPAINVGGIPVYADLYQTDSTVALLPNFNYLGYKIHAEAAFAVAGPESLLPQFQLGYVLAVLCLLSQVCSQPRAQGKYTGWTGALGV